MKIIFNKVDEAKVIQVLFYFLPCLKLYMFLLLGLMMACLSWEKDTFFDTDISDIIELLSIDNDSIEKLKFCIGIVGLVIVLYISSGTDTIRCDIDIFIDCHEALGSLYFLKSNWNDSGVFVLIFFLINLHQHLILRAKMLNFYSQNWTKFLEQLTIA